VGLAGFLLKAETIHPEPPQPDGRGARARAFLLILTAVMVALPVVLFLVFELKSSPAK
jgi:hypothetical protein